LCTKNYKCGGSSNGRTGYWRRIGAGDGGVGYSLKTKMDSNKVEVIKAKISPTVTVAAGEIEFDIEGESIKPGFINQPGAERG